MIGPLRNWLDQRADDHASHPAIVCDGAVLTYAELALRAAAAAERLVDAGVRAGDRVGVLLENGIAFAVALHALMRVGAVLVPLDRRLRARELQERLGAVEASHLLVGSGGDILADEVLAGCGAWESVILEEPTPAGAPDCGAPALAPAPDITLGAAHAVVFTSGTTGRARGVVLTYGNHLWSALAAACNMGLHPQDRWLACLPFCHIGGLSILLRSVIYGTTAVVHGRFDAHAVNAAIDEAGVTVLSVVAGMLQRMLDARGATPYPPWLRCVLVGGGPVPEPLLERCAAHALPVVQTYGMTEAASQIATLAPHEARQKLGSAGKALFGTQLRVRRDGAPVRSGEVGEIEVRGPTLTPGYYGSGVPATASDGWFRTGDLGWLDGEGYLYVVGRRDDLILSGGENIHPVEVENVLALHPDVAEACVAGVPDPHWGMAVAAWVRPRAGAVLAERELQDHVRARLAAFKVPKRVFVVSDFPRTPSGKIRRGALASGF
jgi:O-succinylbenzoic acid--CoA ligase